MNAYSGKKNTGPLNNADALARQAHANLMKAAQAEFAAVMRQLNQPAPAPMPNQPEPALPETETK